MDGSLRKRLTYDEVLEVYFVAVEQYRDGEWCFVGLRHVTPADWDDFGVERPS